MNFYETVFIARQDITNAQVEVLAHTLTQIIKDHKGEVSKTEMCGLKNLAYKIKKNKKGHYVLMNITCDPTGIAEMERQIKLNPDILRCLTLRVEELDPNPSKLMQRAYTDDRYRNYDENPDQTREERSYSDKPSRPRYQAAQGDQSENEPENEGETV